MFSASKWPEGGATKPRPRANPAHFRLPRPTHIRSLEPRPCTRSRPQPSIPFPIGQLEALYTEPRLARWARRSFAPAQQKPGRGWPGGRPRAGGREAGRRQAGRGPAGGEGGGGPAAESCSVISSYVSPRSWLLGAPGRIEPGRWSCSGSRRGGCDGGRTGGAQQSRRGDRDRLWC